MYVAENPELTKEDVDLLLSEFESYYGIRCFIFQFEGGGFAVVPWESIDTDHNLVFKDRRF